MPARTPAERSELAELASHARWAAKTDPPQPFTATDHQAALQEIQDRRKRRRARQLMAEAAELLNASGLADAGYGGGLDSGDGVT
jgi:hypothetical protein